MKPRLTLLSLLLATTFSVAMADQTFRNQRYDALNVLDLNDKSIVFVGNSITNMHDWFEAFGQDGRVCGRGVSGAVSSELLDNIEAILAGHPAKLFIMIGTNDLGTYFDSEGKPIVETPFNNIKKILTRITKESPNTEVYVQAVLPTCNTETYIKRVTYTKQLNTKTKEYMESLGNNKLHFLDTFTPLLSGNVLNSKYTADGIHLYASGYQVWCNVIKDEVGVETIYPDPKSSPISNISQDGFSGVHLMRASYFNSYPVADDNILLIGDDMINGGEWHELFHSTKVLNRGSGWGYNSFDIPTMTKALPAILHGEPAPAQIWLCPAHKDASSSVAASTFKKNVEAFITAAKAKLAADAKTKIVLMACPPSDNQTTNSSYIAKYNTAMKEVAEAQDGDVEYVDIYTPLLNGKIANTQYSTGGRVYGKGYVKMAQTMLPLIQEVDPQAWVLSDEETNTLYNKIAARKTLGELCLSAETIITGEYAKQFTEQALDNVKTALAQAWTLLESDASKADLDNKAKNLNSALQAAEGTISVAMDKNSGEFTVGKGNFNSRFTANKTGYSVYIDCGVNNMAFNGDNLQIYSGTALSSTYNIVAPDGYSVSGYRFSFSGEAGIKLTTCDGQNFTTKTTSQALSVTGLNDEAYFVLAGANKGITLKDFYVDIVKSTTPTVTEERVEVFVTKGSPNYRIPAIATTRKGTVVAVGDYRYGGSDIGYGSVELRRRISYDNGKTWGDILEFTHGQYATSPTPKYDAAYGDPCIVADKTSDRIMVMSCSGNTGFPNGTRKVHQGIARFYSTDEGESWSEPVNLESMFYSLLDNSAKGPIRSMFIGSGRIFQSNITKVGDYYRLYCSGLVKDVNGTNCNYVYYSDDFGETWNVLGDINTPAISNGDEPKAEEMPDGSIICSSRISGGRRFNIFTFTNMEKAEGTWGTECASNSSNKGVIGPSCNGEIMIIPVTRNSDGKAMYLALHSTPASASSRSNVSIYYKGLPDFDSFKDATTFAANWEGKHQATKLGSAYSTFTLMQNNHIGFFFEESTYGKDYTLVFIDYTIEQITNGAYSYNDDMNRAEYLSEHIQAKIDKMFETTGQYVGMIDITKKADVDALVDTFRKSQQWSDYEAILTGLQNCKTSVEEGKTYIMQSKLFPNYYLTYKLMTTLMGQKRDEASSKQEVQFESAGNGQWHLYLPYKNAYIANTPALNANIPCTAEASEAGAYTLESTLEGLSMLTCQNPKNAAYPVLTINAAKKIVPQAGGEGAYWYIESVGHYDDIQAVMTPENARETNSAYNMNGQIVNDSFRGIVIKNGKKTLLR